MYEYTSYQAIFFGRYSKLQVICENVECKCGDGVFLRQSENVKVETSKRTARLDVGMYYDDN